MVKCHVFKGCNICKILYGACFMVRSDVTISLRQKCPFDAINILNLPSNLEKETTHRYSQNSFKLHRLPIPRPGEVLGLVGTNGIGKSTALKILAGKQKPNLGRFTVRLDNMGRVCAPPGGWRTGWGLYQCFCGLHCLFLSQSLVQSS